MKRLILILGLALLPAVGLAEVTTATVLGILDRTAIQVGLPTIQALTFVAADQDTSATLNQKNVFKTRWAVAYAKSPRDIRGIFLQLSRKEQKFVLGVIRALKVSEYQRVLKQADEITSEITVLESAE